MDKLPDEIQKMYKTGNLAFGNGKIAKGIDCYTKVISEIKKKQIDSVQDFLFVLHKEVGYFYYSTGDIQNAMIFYNEAMNIAKQMSDQEKICGMLNSIGVVYNSVSNFERAKEYFKEALNLSEETENKKCKVSALNNIAIIHKTKGENKKALDFYENSLKIVREIGDGKTEITILNNIGEIKNIIGEHDKALEKHQEALCISRKIPDPLGEARSLHHIGRTYDIWRKYDLALMFYNKALDFKKKHEITVEISNTLNNLGNIHINLRNFDEARKCHEEALELRKKSDNEAGVAQSYSNLGALLSRKGKNIEATKYHRLAAKIFNRTGHKRGLIASYNGVGTSKSNQKKYKKALRNFKKALAICKEINEIHGEGTSLLNIGITFQLMNKLPQAVEYLKKAFYLRDLVNSTGISSNVRITARMEQQGILSSLVSCLLQLEDTETSLAFIEHSRGREMEITNLSRKHGTNPVMRSLISKISEIKELITKKSHDLEQIDKVYKILDIPESEMKQRKRELNQERENLAKKCLLLQEELWVKFPTKGLLVPPNPNSLIVDFKTILEPKWVILDFFYVFIEKKLIIFCIEKDKRITVFEKKVERREIKELTERYPDLIKLRYESSIKEEKGLEDLGRKMYKLLIPNSLQEFLKSTDFEYLTIIPTMEIHSLPLEIMFDGEDYWGLKYNLSRAYNLQSLRTAMHAQNERQMKKALLIGNPTKGIPNLGLPSATEEVDEIALILEDKKYDFITLKEQEAEVDHFIELINKNHFSIIHFAGHAFFDNYNPDISYLCFREGNELKKLYSNDLSKFFTLRGYPLIILSGCETGGLNVLTGDEIFGMLRGFFEVSSIGLIIAGWSVYDFSAKDFFTSFYRHYSKGKPLSKSLRLARKQLIEIIEKADENKETYSKDIKLIHWGTYRYYGLPFLKS